MRILATSRTQRRLITAIPRWLPWNLAAGALLFGWIWWISVVFDFGMADESWFLQVLTRVAAGDVLYRDVFFGATPLSVYLAAPLVALFGSEIVVVKAFVSACSVVSVLLSTASLQALGKFRRTAPLLLLGLIAYGWPIASAGYTPLAYACLLGCLGAVLAWRVRHVAGSEAGSFGLLALAGGLAGLCFASKQNLGLLAFAALAAAVLVTLRERQTGWRAVRKATLVIGATCTLVVLITLVPILLSGAVSQFLDFGFINKRTYLQTAGITYLDGLRALPRQLLRIRSFDALRSAYLKTIFVLPPVALNLLFLAYVMSKRKERGHLAALALFTGAALLGVYPRADIEHVIYAVPAVLLSLFYAGSILVARIPPRLRSAPAITLAVWFALGIALLGGGAVRRVMSPDYERSTLPHFRGVWLTKHEHSTHQRYAAELRSAATRQQPFILSSFAAFSYLVAGLENPTPFDYPVVTAFGQNGAANLMRSIEQGRIRSICMTDNRRLPLAAHQVMQFVAAHMDPVTELEFCTLYQSRLP